MMMEAATSSGLALLISCSSTGPEQPELCLS